MGTGDAIAAVVVCFTMLICGAMIGASMQDSSMKRQAIDAGVAQWSIDPQTGKKSFDWLSELPQDEPPRP